MMQFLETRIIPPLVMAIFAIVMWAVAQITPSIDLGSLSNVISRMFLVAGFAILFVAAFYFFKAKTTLNPMNPNSSSSLVTTGLYKFSRNPIYVADVLFLLSWGFYLSNPVSLIVILGFMPYLNRFQIEPEERALEQLFGEGYVAYKDNVRRWI